MTAGIGLSGHDHGRYAAILHLAVMIGMAFAQMHRTYGPGSSLDSCLGEPDTCPDRAVASFITYMSAGRRSASMGRATVYKTAALCAELRRQETLSTGP